MTTIEIGKKLYLEDLSKLLSPVDNGDFKGVHLTLQDYDDMLVTYINLDIITALFSPHLMN